MAVRRLYPEQPTSFAFSAENSAWAERTIAKYPPGKQASAIIPLLWRAQEQNGWLTEPAIRAVCDQLGMAYIRGLEIATFYTMFQLAPVGSKAHVQVCGTTPCMLRGSGDLIKVCKSRISEKQHALSADGALSWEEVECLGNCANAPLVQIDKDTFEDLTPELLEKVLDGFMAGKPPKAGSQIGRQASCPDGGATSLTDPTLYDGSTVGAWKKRFEEAQASAEKVVETAPPSALASPAHKAAVAEGSSPSSPAGANKSPPPADAKPAAAEPGAPAKDAAAKPEKPLPAALAAMANAGLVKDLAARGSGKPLSVGDLDKLKVEANRFAAANAQPELLKAPRDGKGDDLGLIWGVGDVLAKKLNDMGVWHFEQIAKWTPANVAWFENELTGFKGRVARDKWIEQCEKLASGWRPDSNVGERPKD